jgi:dihydrofolate reductase
MPKIILNAFLTLDGVMQAPGGPDEDREGGFSHGGWQAPYVGDVMGRLVTEGIADADGFLLGRKTYDIFASYWPKVTDPNDPIATALNSRPKYVLSRSLERVTWKQCQADQGRRGHRTAQAPPAARSDAAYLGQHRRAADADEE